MMLHGGYFACLQAVYPIFIVTYVFCDDQVFLHSNLTFILLRFYYFVCELLARYYIAFKKVMSRIEIQSNSNAENESTKSI